MLEGVGASRVIGVGISCSAMTFVWPRKLPSYQIPVSQKPKRLRTRMNAVKQEEAVHGTRRDGSRRQGASVRKWRLCQRRCRALLMTAPLNSLNSNVISTSLRKTRKIVMGCKQAGFNRRVWITENCTRARKQRHYIEALLTVVVIMGRNIRTGNMTISMKGGPGLRTECRVEMVGPNEIRIQRENG